MASLSLKIRNLADELGSVEAVTTHLGNELLGRVLSLHPAPYGCNVELLIDQVPLRLKKTLEEQGIANGSMIIYVLNRVKWEHLSIAICGHTGSGKSTFAGRLMFECDSLSTGELDDLAKEAERLGRPSSAFAFFMDRQQLERERGATITCTTKEFYTDTRVYSIIDAPGTREFIKNMLTGASMADCAVVTVPADDALAPALAKGNKRIGEIQGRTRQHARLLQLFGVSQLCVCVTKMDCHAVELQMTRYNEVVDSMKAMLVEVGWKKAVENESLPMIPISGWLGDNVFKKSNIMLWWKGLDLVFNKQTVHVDTVHDVFQKVFYVPQRAASDCPMRLTVHGVHNIENLGYVVRGCVHQGTIRCGDTVVSVPTGACYGKVIAIEMHRKRIESATSGDIVALQLEIVGESSGLARRNVLIQRGDPSMVSPHVNSCLTVRFFSAQVMVVDIQERIPTGIQVGSQTIVYTCGGCRAVCYISAIKWMMGKRTGGKKMEDPDNLVTNEMAECIFQPQQPIMLDAFDTCKSLSRIFCMEGNDVIMLGKVVSVQRGPLERWRMKKKAFERVSRYRQERRKERSQRRAHDFSRCNY